MAGDMAIRRGWVRQGLMYLAVTLLTIAAFRLTLDVLLGFVGGVLIGLFLGYWLLPIAVDHIRDREITERLMRRQRGR